MKIGVTGASGLVGYNVCKEILANGDSLNLLIREDVSYLKAFPDIKVFKYGCMISLHLYMYLNKVLTHHLIQNVLHLHHFNKFKYDSIT